MAIVASLAAFLPSTAYILLYTLPLFIISILLTFAGTFLTLDRTRSFPPCDVLSDETPFTGKKRVWLLEGGVGGLSLGYVFGLHLSTFLSLLIPSVSSLPPLSPKSFLAVWILSAIPTTFSGGRWKYCALSFAGISGGALIALALSIIIHPSLLSRVILTAITIPILTIMTLLPFANFQHACLRFATSVIGSFGLTLSIALLANIPGWIDVWDRLWLNDSVQWGSGAEKGLSAAFCLFLCVGMLSDWILKRKFGECPDQKWDYYLAKYASNLPNRAGTFQPLQSFWDRTFNPRPPAIPKNTFLPEEELKLSHQPSLLSPHHSPPIQLWNHDTHNTVSAPKSGEFELRKPLAFLKKGPLHSTRFQAKVGKRKEAVKFAPLGGLHPGYSSDSDNEDMDKDLLGGQNKVKPWIPPSPDTALETRTAAGGMDDHHLDAKMTPSTEVDRSPTFIRQHNDRVALVKSGSDSQKTKNMSSPFSLSSPSPSLEAVPATPSLIKALNRVAVAQRTALGPPVTPSGADATSTTECPSPLKLSEPCEADSLPQAERTTEKYNGPRWDVFWKDVRAKAMT